MNIAWPQFTCTTELAARIPAILEDGGFQVLRREPRGGIHGVQTEFQHVVSDGLHRAAIIGVKHNGSVILFLRPVRSGWRLHALLGRKKFVSAIAQCLLRRGVTSSALPDEAKLRYLTARGDRVAKAMLDALRREKKATRS